MTTVQVGMTRWRNRMRNTEVMTLAGASMLLALIVGCSSSQSKAVGGDGQVVEEREAGVGDLRTSGGVDASKADIGLNGCHSIASGVPATPGVLAFPSNDAVTVLPAPYAVLLGIVPNILFGIATDASGNIFTAVNATGIADAGSKSDFGVARLNPALEAVWIAPVEVPGENLPIISAGALGPGGETVVTGSTILKGASGSEPIDATTIKFTSNGQRAWTVHFAYGDHSYGRSAAFQADGSLIVAGTTNQPGATSTASDTMFLLKYSPEGSLVWMHYYCEAGAPNSMAIDSKGQIYAKVAGTRGTLMKFDASGGLIYSVLFANSAAFGNGRIALSTNEKALYLVGSGSTTGVFSAEITKFDTETGVALWTRVADTVTAVDDPRPGVKWTGKSTVFESVVFLGDAIYFSGLFSNQYTGATNSSTYLPYVAAYDLDGNLRWFQQFTLPKEADGLPHLAADGNGNLVMFVQHAAPTTDSSLIWRLSPTGALL